MEKLETIKKQLKEVKTEMQIVVFNAFFENANVIEEMNRDQLRDGYRADGVPLPNYSEVSIRVYGKPRGRIKLFDTGAFYKGFQLDANPTEAFLLGTDEKTDMLEETYGEQIIGLSAANKELFRVKYLLPAIAKELKLLLND